MKLGAVSHLDIELEAGSVTLDFGRCYLICEKRMDKALRIVTDFYYSGSCTLCISRMHPDVLDEKIPDASHASMWLSEQPGPHNIGPTQTQKVVQRVRDFLIGRKNAVVLLEGIEYLSTYNDPDRILRMFDELYDAVMARGAILIIPLDPQSLDPRLLARLRRYAEIVQ